MLSALLARFLGLVNFSRKVFFSLHISTDTTPGLMLVTFQLGYYRIISDLSPSSPPRAAILISLITLFHFLTKEYTLGVPTVAKWVKNMTAVAGVAAEARVQSLAYTVGQSCSSDSVPGPGTYICHKDGHKIKKRKIQVKKRHVWIFLSFLCFYQVIHPLTKPLKMGLKNVGS